MKSHILPMNRNLITKNLFSQLKMLITSVFVSTLSLYMAYVYSALTFVCICLFVFAPCQRDIFMNMSKK